MRIFSFGVLLSGDRWFAKGDQFVAVNLQTWSMERSRILLIQFGFILYNISIENSVADMRDWVAYEWPLQPCSR